MRYALYILETLAWRLFFSRTLVHCGLRLICCPGNNEKTIQNIRYWALITDELWINHKDFKCTVATVFTNVFERLHKLIKWIRVNNECQRSFHCLTSNHLSLQQPALHFRLLGGDIVFKKSAVTHLRRLIQVGASWQGFIFLKSYLLTSLIFEGYSALTISHFANLPLCLIHQNQIHIKSIWM